MGSGNQTKDEIMAAVVGAVEHQGESQRVIGVAGVNDNDIVIEIENVERYEEFSLMSTGGAMDVFPSLDGTNFATAPLSLADLGAVVTDPVLATVANRIYRFRGIYKHLRIRQVGGTAVANPVLICSRVS
jgi:hypothetical protein